MQDSLLSASGDNFTSSSVSQPLTQGNHFPFLRLPPEIRKAIYRFILFSDTSCDVLVDHRVYKTLIKPSQQARHIQLFLVCKQIHSEARPILYSETSFTLTIPASSGWRAIQRVCVFDRALIRRLTIAQWVEGIHVLDLVTFMTRLWAGQLDIKLLATMENLQELTLCFIRSKPWSSEISGNGGDMADGSTERSIQRGKDDLLEIKNECWGFARHLAAVSGDVNSVKEVGVREIAVRSHSVEAPKPPVFAYELKLVRNSQDAVKKRG